MLKVFFHFQANAQVGMGHAMRCLNLANGFAKKGNHITFMIDKKTISLIKCRLMETIKIYEVNTNPIEEMAQVLKQQAEKHLLVLDHYGISNKQETELITEHTRTLVIDDLADRPHICNLLLDQTIGRQQDDYKALCPESSSFFLGPTYALLDENYNNARSTQLPRSIPSDQGLKVALSFGGADPDNITGHVLDALEDHLPIQKIDLIVGKANPHIDDLKEKQKSSPYPVHINQDITHMADFLAHIDLVIGAGGVSATERACLGIPSIFIEIADNQKMVITGFCKEIAGINIGKPADLTPQNLKEALQKCAEPATYSQLSQNAAQLCDGLGVVRVVNMIENMYN